MCFIHIHVANVRAAVEEMRGRGVTAGSGLPALGVVTALTRSDLDLSAGTVRVRAAFT